MAIFSCLKVEALFPWPWWCKKKTLVAFNSKGRGLASNGWDFFFFGTEADGIQFTVQVPYCIGEEVERKEDST